MKLNEPANMLAKGYISSQNFCRQSGASDWCNDPKVSCNSGSRVGQMTDNPQWQDQHFNYVANLEMLSRVDYVKEGSFRCPESTSYTSACTTSPILFPFYGLDAASSSKMSRCYSADDLSQIVNSACGSRLTDNFQNLGNMASTFVGKEDSTFLNFTVQKSPEISHVSFEESSIFPNRDLGDLNSVLKQFLLSNSRTSIRKAEQLHHSHGLLKKPEVDCPVARQAISSQLPPLHPTRNSAAPENSTIFCHEITNALQSSRITNKGHSYMEHKIIRTYIRYKSSNTSMANCHGSYIDYFHSKVCNLHSCICDRVIAIVSHFDGCNSVECKICFPFRDASSARVSDQNVKCANSFIEENKEAYFSGSSFSLDCESRTEGLSPYSVISDGEVHPSKRMKLDNSLQPFVSEDDSMSPTSTLKHHKFDRLHMSLPWAGSPISTTSFDADCEHSENRKIDFSDINQVENGPDVAKLDSECAEVPYGELNIVYELEECCESVPLIGHDAVEHLSQSGMLVSSEELCDATRETSMVVGSVVNAPEISGKLIKQNHQQAKGVSILECLTAEEVREHISSLRLSCGPVIAKGEREVSKQGSDENTWQSLPALIENKCQLCKSDELLLAPPPLYCSSCAVRVKRNMTYYITSHDGSTPYCMCTSCYKLFVGRNTITLNGIVLSRDKLEKKKNDDEIKEPWVQCDSCKQWQHQICSLFNSDRDMEGKAEYKCPKCYVKALEAGESDRLPKAFFFSSQDLPRNKLSDFLEERLFRRLKEELEERARTLEKSCDKIPNAKELVVRVVSSDGKPLEVKQLFLDIFDHNYPSQFPQTSKVILLFQKIDGVDVCLFGLYVQEFGSDCRSPNQRCVYISYLDSVKYFRPAVPTTSGVALRTYVYHEILDTWSTARNEVSCHATCGLVHHIKAKTVFYCHPENQRTPKPEKLRQWYHSMLRKAATENIVVHTTNLYDEFFIPTGHSSSKITAARLPYFGGDYWCGTAEKVIKSFEQKNGVSCPEKVKNFMRKRTLKAMGYSDIAGGAAKDALLMQKLGQALLPAKEDFIVVHLQYMCSHCQDFILSGWRWSCSKCKYFQLCQTCNEAEQNLRGESSHSLNGKENHLLSKVLVDDVPSDTKDEDPISDNWLFSNRHTLLGVCQNHHYQFDTLRRAKYSSMMLLHHLGNRMMPAVPACKVCHKNSAENGDVCAACSQKEQLDVLLHASQCGSANEDPCSDLKCLEMKRFFHHAATVCKIRVPGGCQSCIAVWSLLLLHSKSCSQEVCLVPRCMDIKAHQKWIAR